MMYRKTFVRSDMSRTLRDLGLTPSAVSLTESARLVQLVTAPDNNRF